MVSLELLFLKSSLIFACLFSYRSPESQPFLNELSLREQFLVELSICVFVGQMKKDLSVAQYFGQTQKVIAEANLAWLISQS